MNIGLVHEALKGNYQAQLELNDIFEEFNLERLNEVKPSFKEGFYILIKYSDDLKLIIESFISYILPFYPENWTLGRNRGYFSPEIIKKYQESNYSLSTHFIINIKEYSYVDDNNRIRDNIIAQGTTYLPGSESLNFITPSQFEYFCKSFKKGN